MSEQFANLIGVNDFTNEELDLIKETKGRPQEVLAFIVKDYDNLGVSDDVLYFFNGKYYEPLRDSDIHRLIYAFYMKNGLRTKFNLSKERELVFSIKHNDKLRDLNFDADEALINLNNGVFNIDSGELLPHDKKHMFSYCLDVDFKPEDKACPVFLNFLDGLFASSGEWEKGYVTDKDEVENILRLCGYLIYPRVKKQVEKMFILLGEGSNGKSVLIDTIKMFFPKKFITSMSLTVLSNEEGFQRESIIHSRVNVSVEERNGEIKTEELKKIISGETISVNRKWLGGGAIDITPRCKVLAANNNMPYFSDTSFGTVRRLQLFHFKNRFMEEGAYAKEKEPIKYRIFKQVNKDWLEDALQKEKSAIFNQFLAGLARFKAANWKFIETDSARRILEDYREGSDTLGTWLVENFEIGNDEAADFMTNQEIYNEFCDWYQINFNKKTTSSTSTIGKRIKERFRLEPTKRYSANGQIYGYMLRRRDPIIELTKELGQPESSVDAIQSLLKF